VAREDRARHQPGERRADDRDVRVLGHRYASKPVCIPAVATTGPLERAPDERLLLGRARERRERRLRVPAVLLLRLDVDEVELHRVARDAVAAERLHDHLGAVRAPGHLELDAEPERAEALLERRAAEVPEDRRGADGRRERQVVLRLGSLTSSAARKRR
jgi:hypothetical protein